jgi:NAD dependent epimerase/dehydratase
MNKMLVTGAAGFVGSHLVEELIKMGLPVRAYIHYNSRNDLGNLSLLSADIFKELEILSGNIEDSYSVQRAVRGCDTVFHLAALIGIPYSYLAPESYINTNVRGTLNIMQACNNENVEKVVHTSTSETYGTAIYTPIDEKHPLQGQSPYSASKIGADKIVESFHRSYNLPVATIRPFNIYGPRQSARAIIPTIITQALNNKAKIIHLGSISPIRDLTYIKDTIRGFIQIAQSKKSVGEVINIGFGKGISIEELAKRILDIIDPEIRIVSDQNRVRPVASEVMKLICDNQKARQLINWEPSVPLEIGLQETIQFISENIHLYRSDIYNV